jgi:phosphate transport system substrate-binding protein
MAAGIDDGAGCVGPSDETIGDGNYSPLSRPLFIYVRKEAGDEAYVNEFVRYFLSEEGRELAAEAGYIAYPDRVYDLALARFDNGRTGTLFGGATPKRGSVEEVLAANQ